MQFIPETGITMAGVSRDVADCFSVGCFAMHCTAQATTVLTYNRDSTSWASCVCDVHAERNCKRMGVYQMSIGILADPDIVAMYKSQ